MENSEEKLILYEDDIEGKNEELTIQNVITCRAVYMNCKLDIFQLNANKFAYRGANSDCNTYYFNSYEHSKNQDSSASLMINPFQLCYQSSYPKVKNTEAEKLKLKKTFYQEKASILYNKKIDTVATQQFYHLSETA